MEKITPPEDWEFMGRIISREEQERRDEERARSLVTPELLTHFTPEEALELVKYFEQTPSSSSRDTFDLYHLSQEAIDFLAREITGRRVIELGAAGDRINGIFFIKKCGARSFEMVDPKYEQKDGLTYLMRQENESAIVTSFGVLEEGVLYAGSDKGPIRIYQKELGKEIYRVTPRGAITFHGLEWDFDLRNTGFVDDPRSPRELNTVTPQWHGFKVLRKH